MTARLSAVTRHIFRNFSANREESRLRRAARLILEEPAGRLLDIGCGDGAFTSLFTSADFRVYGLELVHEQARRAGERGVQAVVHDLSNSALPFRDGMFGVVFAGEVIEHVIDTSSLLRETHRVLTPGGALIITTPNLASFENRLRLVCGLYPKWVEYQLEGGHGHVRAYTAKVLVKQLRDTGFAVEKETGNWVPFVPQRFADDVRYPFLAITGKMFPRLAMGTIVKARKPVSDKV